MNLPLPEPYATHYYNKGGASIWHKGPSNRLDADKSASIEYPLVHFTVDVFTADQVRQAQREAVAAAVPEGFKLASDLLTALDDLVSACELPGDHCEIDQALPAAIRILESAKAMLAASPEVKP